MVDTPKGLDALKDDSTSWDDGIVAVRGTVKWTVAAFAAVATALFGAGLITRPTLSIDTNRAQLVLAAIWGVVGIVAIVVLISQVAGVFVPAPASLRTMNKAAKADFDSQPSAYFGASATGAAPEVQLAFARLQRSAREQEWSDAALAVAKHGDPGDPVLTSKLSIADGYLNGARALESEFDKGASLLLDEARYYAVKDSRGLKWWAVASGGVAIVAGILFQLTLSSPADAKATTDDTAAASPSPYVATLTEKTDASGMAFWSASGLDVCSVQAKPAGRTGAAVPMTAKVLVMSGSGTAADPYVVRTVPSSALDPTSCLLKEFNVVDGVAALAVVDVPTTVPLRYAAVTTSVLTQTVTSIVTATSTK